MKNTNLITMGQFLAILLVTACLAASASAANRSVSADEEGLWQDHSLVYAKVIAITNTGLGEYRINIEPLGTLAGKFDCGLSAEVTFDLYLEPVPKGWILGT